MPRDAGGRQRREQAVEDVQEVDNFKKNETEVRSDDLHGRNVRIYAPAPTVGALGES